MKGIILAAGKGTRLGAATLGIGPLGVGMSKPLIPTYDKPTVYYPLSDLISIGVSEILVIAAPDNVDQFKSLLGTGDALGISIEYAVQDTPRGIAEAFIIAEDFIGNSDVALTFGDNIFSGVRFTETLRKSISPNPATVFAYYVRNPEEFGVVQFDKSGKAISLEEKPASPKSHYAVPGVYLYDSSVVDVAKTIKPSARGELEITDVNRVYLDRGELKVVTLDSDTHWFDTGMPSALLSAAEYVKNFQIENQRLLGSPEAAAYLAGRIDEEQLMSHAKRLLKSDYGRMLEHLALNQSW